VAEGGLARAARSKREAGSQFGRSYHGGAPCTGGPGVHPGGKKSPPKLLAMDHGSVDVIRSVCTVHPKWHPQRRWLGFEGAAADIVRCILQYICHIVHCQLQGPGQRPRPRGWGLFQIDNSGRPALALRARSTRPRPAVGADAECACVYHVGFALCIPHRRCIEAGGGEPSAELEAPSRTPNCKTGHAFLWHGFDSRWPEEWTHEVWALWLRVHGSAQSRSTATGRSD
jgi:hypothetical protein